MSRETRGVVKLLAEVLYDPCTTNDDEKKDETGSMETRKENMQTPIPSPTSSPRKTLSSDKTLSQELTATVSPSTATTSKVKRKSKAKSKARSTSIKAKILPRILDHYNNVVPELTFAKINEMLKEEISRLVNLAVNQDREISPTNVPNSSKATTSTVDMQHQLYLTMKSNLQDQAADPEHHDDHHYDAAPPEGEKWGERAYILPFLEEDLEEKLKRWVRKEFKTFNEEARLSIQHWKDRWHKRMYKINQRRFRDNLEDYFSNHRITEVVKITSDQQHGLDYMEQIIMMRENNKPDSFSEADFKYINKNDIEDLYYLCLNKKFYDAILERVLKEVKLKIFKSEPWKKPPLLGELDLDILKAFERETSKRLRHRVQMRRKAHLLEDKQISSVGVFDEHLEEIHVTLTQFGKKHDKIATLHQDDQDLAYSSSASSLQVLRRLGSIFTSVYETVQKLKKAFGKSFSSAWGGQLNAALVLSVENFTNWKKSWSKKPEGQWNGDERKAANLDQRLKSLIMHVLLDDQMNSVINCLTTKSTWDDLILYHEGPYDVKESRVMDLKLCYNTFKFKEDNIYETKKNKSLVSATPLLTAFISTSIVQDFQDSPDDEEDIRSSHEYLNDLKEEYQTRALLDKSKRFFKNGTQRFSSAKATDQTECHKYGKKGHFARDCWSKALVPSYQSPFQPKPLNSSQHKPELRPTKDFKAKYNKVKAKLALLSLSASASKAVTVKNKGLIAEAYEWDEEEVSSDDNKMVEVKVLMALAEENDAVNKEGAGNEQRNNLLSKHRDLVHELNACKEQLLVLKQAKLDFLTMQHVNTKILKENKNLRTKLKELTAITETWLNSSNKVNQYISEQISSQKKRILGVDNLLTELIPPSYSSGQKDLVFVKSSADDTKMSIPADSQRNTTGPSITVTDSSATKYDSADEYSVCSTPLPPLKKLDGAEPISGSKSVKSILRSKSTLKAETLKGVKINEPSSAPAKGNKSSSASKVNSAPAGKLKSVKIKDDPPLAIVIKELNDLKLQISKNQSSYSRNNQQDYLSRKRDQSKNPQHDFKRCESCGSSTHTTTDHYDIKWFKRGEALQAKKAEALKSTRAESSNANRSKAPTRSGCSRHMTGVKSYLHKYEE
ncbi:hypothetical protein Tco_0158138 [Tanacetum coccineum]